MMRVADYIANYIHGLGVTEVFLVSGGGMMFLADALKQHPNIRIVCNHHEQASAMAGVSYAKYNGNLGVVYVTTGCGGTNAVTGLLGAFQDNVPCLFVSGQSKRKETVRNSGLRLRQFGVQEVDIISVVESLTKYAVMVNDPLEIRFELEKAVFFAKSGRPGPVWLDIPLDVQGAFVDEAKLRPYVPDVHQGFKTEPQPDEINRVKDFLLKAERPIIIAGQGIRLSGGVREFRRFIESHKLPVVATRLGIDLLPSDHPQFIGRIGNKGDRAGNFAVQNADLIVAIGSRLSVSSTGHEYDKFAREATMIVVDIDPEEHKKNTVRIDHFINADARAFLVKIMNLNYLAPKTWLNTTARWKEIWPVCLKEYALDHPRGVNLYHFVDRLSFLLKGDATVIADAGSAFYVTSQSLRLKEGQRYIASAAQAEMGYTLPAAIGVSFARKCRETIGITGDGSFQMNIQELQTVVHHKLPIKLFVWNNDGYLSIRATQSRFFEGRLVGTDSTSGVSFPSVQKIAEAYGIKYFCIKKNSEVEEIIAKILALPEAVLCEVRCQRDQEIIPTVSSIKKPDGTMVSAPLEDMYPFLDREELEKNLLIKPVLDGRKYE